MAVSRPRPPIGIDPDLNVEPLPLSSGVRSLIERMMVEQRHIVDALERLNQTVETHLLSMDGLATDVPPSGPDGDLAVAVQVGASQPVAADAASRVAVRCLGPFRLVVDGSPVESWPPGRARVLFQYLVTRRNRPVARDTLIEALWPDPDAVAAATSLKVAVHALRHLLSQPAGADPGMAIVARGSGYELTVQDLWLDVEEFERCCARGHRLDSEGRGAEAVAEYTRAAELYRGDFLEECPDEWALLRREALKDQYLLALARLADVALASGDYTGCIEQCLRLLEHDRCREDAYRTLMLCHARLGQRGRVQRWYELCVRTLEADLSVEPEPETEALYRRAIAGQFSPPSVRREQPRLTAG